MTGARQSFGRFKFLFLLGFVFTFFVVVSFIFIYFFIWIEDGEATRDGIDVVHKYKFYRMNPETKESTVGFVTLLDESRIKEEGYISYVDSSGHTVVVTELGSTPYECTGICYCDEGDEGDEVMSRRQYKNPFTKKIIYFYIALGLMGVGYDVFFRFRKKCEPELEGVCDKENIKAEDVECVPMDNPPPQIDYDKKNNLQVSQISSDKPNNFFCSGNCQSKKGGGKFDCESIQLDMNIDGSLLSMDGMREEEVFKRNHLSNFCEKRSEMTFLNNEVVSVCEAGRTVSEDDRNPSVQCVRG